MSERVCVLCDIHGAAAVAPVLRLAELLLSSSIRACLSSILCRRR